MHVILHQVYIKKILSRDRIIALTDKYVRLLERMQKTGFNPELSGMKVAIQPVVWAADGTHRLGYLLSRQENIFFPVYFVAQSNLQFMDGVKMYSELGGDILKALIDRYNKLYAKMRRAITGIINFKNFVKHETEIISALPLDTKINFLSNLNSTVSNGKYSLLPNNKNSIWRQRLAFCDKEIVIFNLLLPTQTLRLIEISRGGGAVIRSDESTQFIKRLNEICGERWGYVAGSITESVDMEEYLFETGANYHPWRPR